jgi:hypothetical protein
VLRSYSPVLLAVFAALLLTPPAGAAVPRLTGTVGPGFTITLKRFNKPVRALRAGTYSITVSDRSSIHNFRLRGPGLNTEITSIQFVGTRTVTAKLRKGTYVFVCDPHFTTMKGTFKVG